MLAQYRTDTQALLQNPPAPTTLYALANIDRWINIARGQLAGESEAIRVIGTIPTVVGQRNYDFSDIDLGVSATTGVAGALNVRRINVGIASGQQWIPSRPWEWFDLYAMNNAVPQNGTPESWAQYAQGVNGSFYLDPPPDDVYMLYCDCTCYPITLLDDTTVEAIPYQWTDAVPFFASYYALLSSNTSARQADAARMYEAYKEFLQRARQQANPSVNRWQYEQASDPTQAAKIGLKMGGQ